MSRTTSKSSANGTCKLAPILCAPLIRHVDQKLIELLRSLEPAEWDQQTIAPAWKVRDVAAHLLDTALRKLSLIRDSWFVEAVEIRSAQDVVDLVNRLNKEGVAVYRRLSPAVLIEMMQMACEQSARFHEALDPFAPAAFPVSWAGEDTSLNWFDTARELTERWHHQQQIRVAVDRPGITCRQLYFPVLETFMRGLPHAFRFITAPNATAVEVQILGEAGGSWWLERAESSWILCEEPNRVQAAIRIDQELAWQIFTKAADAKTAAEQVSISGDRSLALQVLSLVAVLA